jgi:hypothetical protein
MLSLFGLCLQLPGMGMQKPGAPATGTQTERRQTEDPFSRFQWLTAAGENRGLVLEGRRLKDLKVGFPEQPSTEVETQVTRPDASSMRITRRVYDSGMNQGRQLVETVVEELRSTPGGGLSATRTISRLDTNGVLKPVRKEDQQTVPAGTDSFRTQTVTQMAGASGGLAVVEKIDQVERKKSGGIVEIERSQLLPDANRGWATAERRVSTTRESEDQARTQEEVYRQDANGKFSLSQRSVSREWKDSQGGEHQETEAYLSDLQGNTQLNARSTIVRVTFSDGSQQTTQTLFQRGPASPSAGLGLIEKIVETLRPVDAKATQIDTEVLAPDSNGVLKTISFRRAVESR